MRKLKYLILTIATLLSFATSCVKPEPPVNKVEYGQVCAKENEGKVIAVQGFLGVPARIPCLMLTGTKRECGLRFTDAPDRRGGTEIIVFLPEGKGKNQADTPEADKPDVKPSSTFVRGQIGFRLNDASYVMQQGDITMPVTVTGEVRLTEQSGDAGICSIHTSKIEKR